jgi:cytochrome P450/NADPH-cytochrome P450 reductase
MIGPGTGLAPFRGFIHERRHRKFHFFLVLVIVLLQPASSFSSHSCSPSHLSFSSSEAKQAREQNQLSGENLLLFGCRHPDIDFLYREELEHHHSSSDINLSVAFSRLDAKKVYVQHLLKQKKKEIVRLLDQGNLPLPLPLSCSFLSSPF